MDERNNKRKGEERTKERKKEGREKEERKKKRHADDPRERTKEISRIYCCLEHNNQKKPSRFS